ncbi:MAG: metallophosphoesterase family protein [Firmicutes bacterium]|nr:metallophosphoesterase family protein [Bacillota bacterium]
MQQVEYSLEKGLIGIIADTHVPTRATSLPPKLFDLFAEVDLILHAGDLEEESVLTELEALAPVEAVAGNMDPLGLRRKLGLEKIIHFDEVSLGLIHGAGLPRGRLQPISQRFVGWDLQGIVFGHSHIPFCGYYKGILFLNPGSPAEPRGGSRPTCALLRVKGPRLQAKIFDLEENSFNT